MSRGAYIGRPSSTSSSSSSSSSTASSRGCITTPGFTSIQQLIASILGTSEITVKKAERLHGRLHQIYLATLTNGSSLVLRCPPTQNIRVLRHEKNCLDTERRSLEILHRYTQLPVPRVIQYDTQFSQLGSSFLMTSFVPGRTLLDISSRLTATERKTIDRTLGAYARALTTLSATRFGTICNVSAKKGSTSWRKEFLALLEAVLRDAEDILVNIPYDSIRYYVERHSHVLDEVTEPRLVALYACEPDNVLIDEDTKQVTGLVGFSDVIWGDSLMCGGFANGSSAFFEGFGECPVRHGDVKARMLMYETYRATVRVVAHHYRPHASIDELEARRSLTCALNGFAQM